MSQRPKGRIGLGIGYLGYSTPSRAGPGIKVLTIQVRVYPLMYNCSTFNVQRSSFKRRWGRGG